MIRSDSILLRALTTESHRVLEGRPSVRPSALGYLAMAAVTVSVLALLGGLVVLSVRSAL